MNQPLAPSQIRAAIYLRVGVASKTNNIQQRTLVVGQIQGLLFALNGTCSNLSDTTYVGEIMELAGITGSRPTVRAATAIVTRGSQKAGSPVYIGG